MFVVLVRATPAPVPELTNVFFPSTYGFQNKGRKRPKKQKRRGGLMGSKREFGITGGRCPSFQQRRASQRIQESMHASETVNNRR